MGVLNCGRRGCEHIMCDHYSYQHGYLCWECLDELISKGVNVDIESFMDSPKPKYIDKDAAETYWKTIFKSRDD